jgi:hypothetical protein
MIAWFRGLDWQAAGLAYFLFLMLVCMGAVAVHEHQVWRARKAKRRKRGY